MTTTTSDAGPFEADGRPAPAPSAPPRDALREVYVQLLAIEQERLAVAVRIEKECGFIFPETSVIVRDVRTLAEKLYGPAASSDGKAAPAPPAEAHHQADNTDGNTDGNTDTDQGDDAESVLARLARKLR